MTKSVFAEFAWKLVERGFSVVPIAPGTKRPGSYTDGIGWAGMNDWSRFADRQPTQGEMDCWEQWPDAGIGVVLGKTSGIIGLDKDYDIPNGGDDALQAIIPWSPVAKKGEKGWTRFFRYNGEPSTSFDVGGMRVLDVLSEGRQTVVPPTAHPSGCSYTWISPDTLDEITGPEDLPTLPADFLAQVAKVLAPYQTEADKQPQKRALVPRDDAAQINTGLTPAQEYYRDLNAVALARLDDWVTRLVPGAKRHGGGYRSVATWRGVTNANVGIDPSGIRDWGGGYGMTPLDLVMYANGLSLQHATDALRNCIKMSDDAPFALTVNGVQIGAPIEEHQPPAPEVVAPTQAPAPRPSLPEPVRLPWQTEAAAPTVMLPPSTSTEPAAALPRFVTAPPGILFDIAEFISAIAPKKQPELSLAAAIALAAVCTQRIYRSNMGNFTSLYMVIVAKSTEGKEHPQGAVEKILTAANLGHLLAGSGYTSAGAVFSALLAQPSHIAIIDEMGKLLKMSRSKGNSNSEAAIDKLVEAFGKLDGVIRPPVYSTMTLNKTQRAAVGDAMVIHNPAITVLGATTPGTFYANLTDDLVQDGFLGRLIVVESVLPRQLIDIKNRGEVPQRIIDWCQHVNNPPARQGDMANLPMPDMPAHTIEMTIPTEARDMLRAFELELNQLKDQYEPEGLDVLLGRTYEKALRLGMIAAKACNPDALMVGMDHLSWAISYVRHYDMAMVKAVRRNRVASQVDGEIKRVVQFIRGARKFAMDPKLAQFTAILASGGMPHQLLLKKMHLKASEFASLVSTATEAGLLMAAPGLEYGYAGQVYRLTQSALDQD